MTTRSVVSGKVGGTRPFTVDNTQALASLAALSDLRPRWVLPGHGDAWNGGLPEALSLIRLSAAPSGSAHQNG
jgi:glyoxylase-like metal-dependent hydrolase (beta-lactamase superfamily II)